MLRAASAEVAARGGGDGRRRGRLVRLNKVPEDQRAFAFVAVPMTLSAAWISLAASTRSCTGASRLMGYGEVAREPWCRSPEARTSAESFIVFDCARGWPRCKRGHVASRTATV